MEGKRLALISIAVVAVSAASARADMKGNGRDVSRNTGSVVAAASAPPELVVSMPSPCEGNGGLAWDGTCLWISDHITMRAYRVDPGTGAVIRSIPLPGTYPNGLAWDGSALWYAESDRDTIYKLDPSNGAVLLSFPSPGPGPSGLEFDGSCLWCSDTVTDFASGTPDRIYCMTLTGVVLAVFDAVGDFPMGMAFDGCFLWHSDNVARTIYKLNPADLAIVDAFASPGAYPNDLAWDGRYLWVVDNETDLLYKFDVGSPVEEESKPSVLLCGANTPGKLADVQQKLQGTGQFSAVGIMDVRDKTPTLVELLEFDAVMVHRNERYHNAVALGNVMADYVDSGGGVVCTMFEVGVGGRIMMQGRWESGQYYAIPRGGQFQATRATLGTVHDPKHPIMRGVATFDGGSSSYRPASLDIAPDAVRIADWSDGRPLVVTKMIGDSRRADLGFYPVSSDVGSDLWDVSTDGALLMANAITWVARPQGPTTAAAVFEETFPSATIDAGKWMQVNGATVDDVGLDEPSAPLSLRLNGYPLGGDSVESATLDLSSCSRATLTYHHQRTGGGESPDADDDLIVEYFDGSAWVELSREVGRGPDMAVFVKRTLVLPTEALHAGFRFRIRSIGTGDASQAYDDWFVDDVKIKTETPIAATTANPDDSPGD